MIRCSKQEPFTSKVHTEITFACPHKHSDWTDSMLSDSEASPLYWPNRNSSVRAQMLLYLWQLFIPELKPFPVLWIGEICSRIFQRYPYRKTERRNYLHLPCTVSLQRSVTAILFPLFKENQCIMLTHHCFSDMYKTASQWESWKHLENLLVSS